MQFNNAVVFRAITLPISKRSNAPEQDLMDKAAYRTTRANITLSTSSPILQLDSHLLPDEMIVVASNLLRVETIMLKSYLEFFIVM